MFFRGQTGWNYVGQRFINLQEVYEDAQCFPVQAAMRTFVAGTIETSTPVVHIAASCGASDRPKDLGF
jgi:hypothetical protein